MKIECRPISAYPVAETRNRVESNFHRRSHGARRPVLLTDSLDLLEREAAALGCRHLVIEADFKEGQIKQDGWPYASAKPSTPRVVVSLVNSRHGPLRYPCDTFTRFEDNVRAVGLALEALRTVDRYGVTRRGEQYAGWRALPASTAPTMNVEAAAILLANYSPVVVDQITKDAGIARTAIRDANRRTHPDAGGSTEEFRLVQAARAVLSAHFGVSL